MGVARLDAVTLLAYATCSVQPEGREALLCPGAIGDDTSGSVHADLMPVSRVLKLADLGVAGLGE